MTTQKFNKERKSAMTFSVTQRRQEEIAYRCKSLGLSRSDYINELVGRDLALGVGAEFVMSPVVLQPKAQKTQNDQ